MTGNSITGPGHLNIDKALIEHQTNADGVSQLLMLSVIDRIWSVMRRRHSYTYIKEKT